MPIILPLCMLGVHVCGFEATCGFGTTGLFWLEETAATAGFGGVLFCEAFGATGCDFGSVRIACVLFSGAFGAAGWCVGSERIASLLRVSGSGVECLAVAAGTAMAGVDLAVLSAPPGTTLPLGNATAAGMVTGAAAGVVNPTASFEVKVDDEAMVPTSDVSSCCFSVFGCFSASALRQFFTVVASSGVSPLVAARSASVDNALKVFFSAELNLPGIVRSAC